MLQIFNMIEYFELIIVNRKASSVLLAAVVLLASSISARRARWGTL